MGLRKVFVKLLTETAKIPTRGSEEAAGRDLYADLYDYVVEIPPNGTIAIPTGLAMSMPKGFVGLVFIRSGMAMKKGLCLANGVGVIDSDYRGEWKLLIHNSSPEPQFINNGDKIAQVVFVKYKDVVFYPVKELDDTGRGDGGFGSTGTR